MPTITRTQAFSSGAGAFDNPVRTHGGDFGDSWTFEEADDRSPGGLSYYILGGNDNDEFFGGPNGDTIKGGGGNDHIYGEGGNDHLHGGAGTDWILGDDGQDQLFGDEGADQLYGGNGSDILDGGQLNDWLDGNEGNDVLVGGADGDWLTGGSGLDTFVFGMEHWFAVDSFTSNPDQVMDFNAAEDVIELEGWGLDPHASQYVEGTIAIGAGYEAAKAHAKSLLASDKKYAFVTDGVDGYLFVDVDPGAQVEGLEMGIILAGLSNVADFDWFNIL